VSRCVLITKTKKTPSPGRPVDPIASATRHGHPQQLVLLLVDGILDLGAHVLDADARDDG